uniref:Uncharacterized protein n=1 Tax=Cannabis sativa TaxID=3483 RepID=A0A803QI01_CANSA
MDRSVENSKRSLLDCLIEDLESDEIPMGVPFEQVTLVRNLECDNINVGETVIVNGEAPETIGYLIGPSDEGQDVCQDECSGEPTGFLNVNPKSFDCGFQFLFTPLVTEILSLYEISPRKLMPNGWRLLLSLEHFTEKFDTDFRVQPNTSEFVDRIIEDIEFIKEEHHKMSQKRTIKIPKASDAMARAKLTTTKKSKAEWSKQVSESNFTDVPLTPSSLGTFTTIKRNAEFLDPEVVDETVLRIPHTVSVYSNPSSIEGYVDGILHPVDRAGLIKLGPTGCLTPKM